MSLKRSGDALTRQVVLSLRKRQADGGLAVVVSESAVYPNRLAEEGSIHALVLARWVCSVQRHGQGRPDIPGLEVWNEQARIATVDSKPQAGLACHLNAAVKTGGQISGGDVPNTIKAQP